MHHPLPVYLSPVVIGLDKAGKTVFVLHNRVPPILLPWLISCSPKSIQLRPEPGRSSAHFPASLWCAVLALFHLHPGREPQLAAMCKGEHGGGSWSPLSQMWIPQLKWKIYILSLIAYSVGITAASQSWVNSESSVFESLVCHLLAVILSKFAEFPQLGSAQCSQLSLPRVLLWGHRTELRGKSLQDINHSRHLLKVSSLPFQWTINRGLFYNRVSSKQLPSWW